MLWDRDYLNGLWAAKSFYRAAGVDWPLYWHQGGALSALARSRLAEHFPRSKLVTAEESDSVVPDRLRKVGYSTSASARGRAFMLRKFFDPIIMGRAEYALAFDTDVLFFRRPDEILNAVANRRTPALYNRDRGEWYNLSAAVAAERYGVTLVPEINAGLGLFRRTAPDLAFADRLLADPDIFSDPWLTEQTLQAMLGSRAGVEHLPPTYAVGTEAGLTAAGEPVVAKHYPGHPRVWLYREGMPALLRSGALHAPVPR